MIGALLGCVLLGTFIAGVYCGHKKTFPFRVLVRFRERLRRVPPDAINTDSSNRFIVSIDSEHALHDQRASLIEYVWGTPSLPYDRLPDRIEPRIPASSYHQFASHADVEWWSVEMQLGIDSNALALAPKKKSQSTAVIYHQGHEGHVTHGASTISRLSKEGFYVVALAMPLLGPNRQPQIETRRHGLVTLSDHNFFPLVDHEYDLHSVRFFLEPVIVCVNQLYTQGFKSIAMLGPSGGGWTTTLCAAIDQRINTSFPIAGSLPFSLRTSREMKDYEQYVPELYAISNYPELHVLGAHRGRFQLQVLNEFDVVAWGGRRGRLYEETVREALARLGGGRFEVMIDSSSSGHGISRVALQRIIDELAS